MHRRDDRTEPLRRRRDALPRVRRCTSRRFFLLLLRTRSCAIGAEASAHQLNEVFAFLGRAVSDRAGARPYQLNVRRRIARERVPTTCKSLGTSGLGWGRKKPSNAATPLPELAAH